MKSTEPAKIELTDPIKCGHCGNFAPMKRAATYPRIERTWDEEGRISWDEGEIFYILDCLSCGKVMLMRKPYFEPFEGDENEPEPEILFPIDDKLPIGLPDRIKKAYEAALKVRNVDANAFGVLVGRILEMICENRKARGRDLHAKLTDLASRGEIPNNLVGVANGLKNLRNVGAHAALGDLTDEEIPILSSLLRAILEYVYSAPHLSRQAEDRLKKFKKRHK